MLEALEETSIDREEVTSKAGILHRLGTFLRGITSRCRRSVERVRNHQKRRSKEINKPRNSDQKNTCHGNQQATVPHGNQQPTVSHGNQPTTTSDENQPPTVPHGNQPSTVPHGNQPPTISHENQPPTASDENQPPTVPLGNQPQTVSHGDQTPIVSHGIQSPTVPHGNQPPTIPHGNQPPIVSPVIQPPTVSHGEQTPTVSHGIQSPTVSQGKHSQTNSLGTQKSYEDGRVITDENTHNVVKCHLLESQIPELTLLAPQTTDEEKELYTSQVLPAIFFSEKENASNVASQSTSPLLTKVQKTTQLHQLLRNKDKNRKTLRETSANKLSTQHVVIPSVLPITRVKSQPRRHHSSQTQDIKDLSRSVFKSLLPVNVHNSNDLHPSYTWLVDTGKTQSNTSLHNDESPMSGPSIPLTSKEHSRLIVSDQDHFTTISTSNEILNRHKRMLNFSRNYVQYGTTNLEEIVLETPPIVEELCSNDRKGDGLSKVNPSPQNDKFGDSSYENFQPLLKLAVSDKQAEIPQSRFTRSHNFQGCFHTSNFDKQDSDTGNLTTVEQGIHVGLSTHPRDTLREDDEENYFIHVDHLTAVNRNREQIVTNRLLCEDTNNLHSKTSYDEADTTRLKILIAPNGQTLEAQQADSLSDQERKVNDQQPKLANDKQLAETDDQQAERTSCQQPDISNGHQQETAHGDQIKTMKILHGLANRDEEKAMPSQNPDIKLIKHPKVNNYELEGQMNIQPSKTSKREQPKPTNETPECVEEQQAFTNCQQAESKNEICNTDKIKKLGEPDIIVEGHLQANKDHISNSNDTKHAFGNEMHKPTNENGKHLEKDSDSSDIEPQATEFAKENTTSSVSDLPRNSSSNSNVVVAEKLCRGHSFDKAVYPIHSEQYTDDTSKDNVEKICRVKEEAEIQDEYSRRSHKTQPKMIRPYTNHENEQIPTNLSSEHTLSSATTAMCVNDMSTKKGLTKPATASNKFLCPHGGMMNTDVANQRKRLNTDVEERSNNTTKQSSLITETSVNSSRDRTKPDIVSPVKGIIINKSFFTRMKVKAPKENTKGNTTDKNAVDHTDTHRQVIADKNKDSSKTEKPKLDTAELGLKCDADTKGNLSNKDFDNEVSMGESKSLEPFFEKTLFADRFTSETSVPESNQVQWQFSQQQKSQVTQMKLLLDSFHDQLDSIHDQTTIESDFSDDEANDYCYSEPAQDVNPSSSPRKNSPGTQRNEKTYEVNTSLLNKREKLKKPMTENLNPSPGTENVGKVENGTQLKKQTLLKDEKHSSSMPNIQPTAVPNESGNRNYVVIKYKRHPYPPEGRPLSASMGAFRFRKIQSVHGNLKKAHSIEDLCKGEKNPTKGYATNQNSVDHGYWSGNSYLQGKPNAHPQLGLNQKLVSTPHAITKASPPVARKIMSKRKTASPSLLRFDSYKPDDVSSNLSPLNSGKRSADVKEFTEDEKLFSSTKDSTKQLPLETNSGINTVGLSPRELAFAQKLSPGERKTLPPSRTEKESYPDVCANKVKNTCLKVPRQQAGAEEKTAENSNARMVPGFKYSENQRDIALRRGLSGSATSCNFLQKAMIERRVILPSRYSARSQKADSFSPTNRVQEGSSSEYKPQQRMENRNTKSTGLDSKISQISNTIESPRIHSASQKIMVKREKLPSSSLTNRTASAAVIPGEHQDTVQGSYSQSPHLGQQSYPRISSTPIATAVDNEHNSLMPNHQDAENKRLNMEQSSEILDRSGIDGGYEQDSSQDLSRLQNTMDDKEPIKNMSGSKYSSTFFNTAISERRALFPSRLRSKTHNSTAGIGPPVLASQGNTTGLRYEHRSSELNMQYENGNSFPTEEVGVNMENNNGGIHTDTETTAVKKTGNNSMIKVTGDNIVVTRDENHTNKYPEDVHFSASKQEQSPRQAIPHFRGRSETAETSRPANKVHYGSSTDPKRRQQLEKKIPGNNDSDSKMLPFSKNTDYPRVSLASKRRKNKRAMSSFRKTNGTNLNLNVASGCRTDDDQGEPSHSQQLSYPSYSNISSENYIVTSVDNEHDFQKLRDEIVENENLDVRKSSDKPNEDEIDESGGQDSSPVQSALDLNATNTNMSGSINSSTFLTLAINERRANFPSRLTSKAHNMTVGSGAPVLVSQSSTTGLQYIHGSEPTIQDGNENLKCMQKFDTRLDESRSRIYKESETSAGDLTADSTIANVTADEVPRDTENHHQQTKSVVEIISSVEEKTSQEENISDTSKNIQLSVPKPMEKLVPSQFPVNKKKLPIVCSPQRETVAIAAKVLIPHRVPTSTASITVATGDSLEEKEAIKPIIRKPPMESIPSVPKKIKNFRFRQKMVLTGRLHHKSEENLKFFKHITKSTEKFRNDHTRNVQ